MSDIWAEIMRLECAFAEKMRTQPGTIIQRTADGWVTCFGPILGAKAMFYGDSIEDCIEKAGSILNETTTT